MSERDDIVKRLMDYDRCHDGDVDEAADEIVSLRQRLAAAEAREQKDIAELQRLNRECVALLKRLAAAEARSYERIAESDEIREQLANAREGDNWVLMARESIANGNCPWCFCMDEGPHQPGCYVNEIEAENSRLHRELCEMSEPRLKLHATIQQLAERLAEAEKKYDELKHVVECNKKLLIENDGLRLSLAAAEATRDKLRKRSTERRVQVTDLYGNLSLENDRLCTKLAAVEDDVMEIAKVLYFGFMICESQCGRAEVRIKFADLKYAQRLHSILVKIQNKRDIHDEAAKGGRDGTPEGLQTELLKCPRPVLVWVLELVQRLAATEAERIWTCGCGTVNGVNLETCRVCGRREGEGRAR